MWAFFGELLKLVREKRWGLIMAMCACAGLAVFAGVGKSMHAEAMAEIQKNQQDIDQLAKNQADISTTLKLMQLTIKNVGENVADLKGMVRQVDATSRKVQEKIVDIYDDVSEIKVQQQKNQ